MLLVSQSYHTGLDVFMDMTLFEWFELMPDAIKSAEETRKRLTRK
jgi:hypothetical protein